MSGSRTKKVIRCGGCNKITRFYGSFKVKVVHPTNEKYDKVLKICRVCAKEAGYKVADGKQNKKGK